MNLLQDPSLLELSCLIARFSNYHENYNLIVDNDGEVLIEPSSPVNSYKTICRYRFYLTGLNGKSQIGILAAKNYRYLNQLYKNLLYCMQNDVHGAIDSNEISSIQTINHWLEINKITSIIKS